MTNEENDLLIAHLVDAGEIDPEGDAGAQFLNWYLVRKDVVSGDVHYKAILGTDRVRRVNIPTPRGTHMTAPDRGRSGDFVTRSPFFWDCPGVLPTNVEVCKIGICPWMNFAHFQEPFGFERESRRPHQLPRVGEYAPKVSTPTKF